MFMKTAENTGLLATLEQRFLKNMARHPSLKWDALHAKLIGNESALAALNSMEKQVESRM